MTPLDEKIQTFFDLIHQRIVADLKGDYRLVRVCNLKLERLFCINKPTKKRHGNKIL